MLVEVSNGELIDKISILSIKLEKIGNENKLQNISKEYNLLIEKMDEISFNQENEIYKKLVSVNRNLWEIEDKIRKKEANKEFDEEFIELARSVYFENDKRFELKKEINLISNSELNEEKDYVKYKQ